MAAPAPLEPVTLMGRHVRLEPLAERHVDGLLAAIGDDRSTYLWASVPNGRAATERYVADAIAGHTAAQLLVFAQVSVATGDVIGSTRLMSPRWETGREQPDEIEIGGTWLTPRVQRTAVNTEAKLLLLRHAFEELGVWRVEILSDADNARSRAAIERLGATHEGVLRNFRRKKGDSNPNLDPIPRDTAMYSILPHEWPAIETRLIQRLATFA